MLRNWEILYFVCLLYLESVQKKLSCRRRIIKSLFEKLCPAVNYGTERYIFSHKSVALSTLVRCKFSFYFFWKILHAWFLSPKTRLDTKKTTFFQKHNFLIVLLKTHWTEPMKVDTKHWISRTLRSYEGADDIPFFLSFHFYLTTDAWR